MINALLFFIVAFIYSSAGFGGGSMYLAILAQSGMSAAAMRMIGLSCNATVTTLGAINFSRNGFIVWKYMWPLLLCSVPACIWAASLKLEDKTYFIALGVCLLLSALAMLLRPPKSDVSAPTRNPWWMFPVSAVIGFLAGITGIGGGVYLSPLLHLSGWGSAKHIAATSSVFILINSLASIATLLLVNQIAVDANMLLLIGAVTLGGVIGSAASSNWLSQSVVRYVTVSLIIFASLRVLIKYL